MGNQILLVNLSVNQEAHKETTATEVGEQTWTYAGKALRRQRCRYLCLRRVETFHWRVGILRKELHRIMEGGATLPTDRGSSLRSLGKFEGKTEGPLMMMIHPQMEVETEGGAMDPRGHCQDEAMANVGLNLLEVEVQEAEVPPMTTAPELKTQIVPN
ncbi:hypothetical protein B0H17DRAFT_1212129 [Mycena rosella]|uniref:Uncharacterized protein n=1 Tax=Mycena rosella TaxID=1033263 RepID=A0AAD7CTA4_MYCRO|nr:hypothetical protein B0H17DRAFT_1212129 [Mycena rosella]